MAETQSSSRVVRFGAFEADLRSGELRKDGVRLKFSGQPFQVLAILLERPGEVVTREELQKRLWPDTFVDFERNLNTAINKIREVLGDSAESPRFVETLPRRGIDSLRIWRPRFSPPFPHLRSNQLAVRIVAECCLRSSQAFSPS
jgi:DNA-binding winged helix-turn-helix (wHTH) protein